MKRMLMQDISHINKIRSGTFVEHDVYDLLEGDLDALGIYSILKKLHNKEWGYACPSIRHNPRSKTKHTTKDLVTLSGKSEATLRKIIVRLEEHGLLRMSKSATSSGNKKLLFYIYQPLIIEEENIEKFKEDLDNKKAFVVGRYKD